MPSPNAAIASRRAAATASANSRRSLALSDVVLYEVVVSEPAPPAAPSDLVLYEVVLSEPVPPAAAGPAPMTRIPLPPPPIAALTISGSGTPLRSGRPSPVTSQDSRTGTPTSASSRLAASLSPIVSMTSAGGPTQVSPAAVTARAKSARSDRNP